MPSQRPSEPLPPNKFSLELKTNVYNAFEQCRTLECRDTWSEFPEDFHSGYSEGIMTDMSPKTVTRVLGHALLVAPIPLGVRF